MVELGAGLLTGLFGQMGVGVARSEGWALRVEALGWRSRVVASTHEHGGGAGHDYHTSFTDSMKESNLSSRPRISVRRCLSCLQCGDQFQSQRET